MKKLAKPKKDKATNNEKVNNALFNSKEPIYYTRKGERTGLSIYFWLWQRFMLNINQINALLEHFKENKQYSSLRDWFQTEPIKKRGI